MFETLKKAPLDKIFALLGEYRADKRPEKLDLGIGVYKDETGNTPIMGAVVTAEKDMLADQTTKSYVGVSGNRGFCDSIVDLIFADSIDRDRIASVQAPGGTGSLWVIMQLLNRARPGAKAWVSDPSWPNHWPMLEQAGLKPHFYPYFDPETRAVKFDEMLACFDAMGPDDIVLLHACCHNPTGANLTNEQWDKLALSLKKTGALPLLDLAYLGFGDGLEADAYGVRKIAQTCPEAMVAFSASKNFGLYRERAGVAIAVAPEEKTAKIVFSQMANVIRASFSQSPDHGAEIVRRIMNDDQLRADWEAELNEMRERMLRLRHNLAASLRKLSNSDEFDFIEEHRGMFSLLGLPPEVVEKLKLENAIYLIDDSRANIAGIDEHATDKLARAILAASA
ncbi:Aspartate aminotransferase [hydrothermal vent metagenome]|uniref:Aspartate aminotransferase n=1 Tax=hydrothermal vent metagenome TaxID=652676 RepID=A0A3B0TYI0_9ZZZZ